MSSNHGNGYYMELAIKLLLAPFFLIAAFIIWVCRANRK